jgi:SAM-dependent methyltransferase
MPEQSRTSFTAGFASRAIVDVYTSLLVPRLFAPWAELLVNRLGLASGASVLDIACGPGTVSRVLARRVGPAGHVLGADYSEAMIAIARGHDAALGSAPIDYRVAPASSLPAEDSSLDAVTCQQGLQFFPDAQVALDEMARVLRPGGRVAIACWAPIDRCTPWNAMHRALGGVLPPERLDVIGAPFSWPGEDRLRDGLRAAGFGDITITRETSDIVFEGGASHLATLIGATPLAADVAALDGDSRRRFEENTAREVEAMLDASGAAHGRMESLLAIARL